MRSDSSHRARSRPFTHVLEISGAIEPGVAIQGGGAGGQQRTHEFVVVVLGAVEHQVLEEVREAGAAGRSSLLPTWYQTSTATIGALWSSWTMRVRPLGRVYFWKGCRCRGVARGWRMSLGSGWVARRAR